MKNLKQEELTTRQKLGMLMCARGFEINDGEDLDFVIELIRDHSLGCVQVPIGRADIMERVKQAADYPIIIVADMEMGYPKSKLPPVPMMALSACNRPECYRAFARSVVTDAQKAGYNAMWGPVIDVLLSDGPCKVYRDFSDDPMEVAKAAEEIARVFANNHFLSCGKHYPGGDFGGVDTHMANLASTSTREELLNKTLVPYFYLLEKGLLPTIMSGHGTHPDVDPDYPASLSKKTIDLIRDRGFDGVCFTDSLAMMAILQQFGEEKIMGMAVAAGNDIVLPNYRSSNRRNFELLVKNYEDGAFTEARLNEAVRRVLAAQAFVGERAGQPDLMTDADVENYYAIASDCITAVTDPGVAAALPADNTDRLFVIVGDQADVKAGKVEGEAIARNWYSPDLIEERIREDFPQAEIAWLPEYASANDNDRVLVAATRHKEVVFVTYCTTRPYLGTDCMTRRAEALINALIHSGKVSAVVHFGNPYALQPIKHVPRRLFGYMMPQSQQYAIDVLAGKLPAKGRLPFKVELP